MRTNLFKKIFTKHLHKGKEPLSTFVDDIGALKGVFTLKEFDKHGNLVNQNDFTNMIVNQSKSSIIRLIGQGQSIHNSNIDPNDYVISKMRFSNDLGSGGTEKIDSLGGPNKLEYYSLTEPSNRISESSEGYAGGKAGSNLLTPPANPSTEDFKHTFEKEISNTPGLSGYTSASDGGKIFDVKSGFKVPSHGSIMIQFYKDFGSGDQLIEEHYYNIDVNDGSSPAEIIYTRAPFANKPWKIVNHIVDHGVDGKFYYNVSTPMNENVEVTTDDINGIRTTIINTTNSTDDNYTGTRLFFDYATDVEGWKIYLEEIASDALKYNSDIRLASGTNPLTSNYVWSSLKIKYTLGLYNVVNLIIPVIGTNEGVGTSILTRYNSNIDYYNVVSPSYQDCADDYIDDYAVTFTTSMSTQQGNGEADGSGNFIQYRKAYLFSKNDQMFSSIIFPSTEFQKDPSNSFQISWKILAPIN